MDRETQVEVVNICIVNALRIDEEHRMMILEKLTQSLTNENRSKLLRLLNVVGRSEQFICDYCEKEISEVENIAVLHPDCYNEMLSK